MTFWVHGDNEPHRYLIADLGLFDVKIADGPERRLVTLMDCLKNKIVAPLKIVTIEEIRGLRPECAGVPDGFTVVTNCNGAEAPGINY